MANLALLKTTTDNIISMKIYRFAILFLFASFYSMDLVAVGEDQRPSISKFTMPAGITAADIAPNLVILKVKSELREICESGKIEHSEFHNIISQLGGAVVSRRFPAHSAPQTERTAEGFPLVDLTLIYRVQFNSDIHIEKTINYLLATGLFQYAEPEYIQQLTSGVFTPNDLNIAQQYFLAKIEAYNGWNIQKGDTNVVIGITDTGTDWDHPDLVGNIKYNYADPINGLDDDNDGYIDNFRGWDLGNNDNNPMVEGGGQLAHGSHVSGCAAASTDNTTGVASPGFRCKFLPVKISTTSGSLIAAYDGITYAADMGCQIINCSWGSTGGGQFGQDVVNYATFNKNSLVIAAAGNNASDQAFYPAAFDNVISVAATNSSDVKAGFSNYHRTVDVSAPGDNIYSTWYNDTYSFQGGTSMAAPVAAGVAGIIKSQFPTYTASQLGEKLRITCDNIYGVPGNGGFNQKLGRGRVNMFRALTETSPAVRMINMAFTDNNDNAFVSNDTIRITGDFINYLAATTNLNVTLSTTSNAVSILDGNTVVGALATLASANNNADPFTVKINPSAAANSTVTFKLTFSDGTYLDEQYFELVVNVDYINVAINDIATSITSKGRLCYNGLAQAEGLGFKYKNSASMVYEAGLMIGNNATQVSDNVRGGSAGATDSDFLSSIAISRIIPSIVSEYDLYGKFNDNAAGATALSVLVTHRTYAWSTPADRQYVIVEYSIKNTGASALSTLHAGIFADWDIMNYNLNKADYDTGTKMGYCWSTEASGLYAGIKLLTTGPAVHYAIDNVTGGAGGINMFDGYSTAEKFQSLSTNRATAGGAGTGNDVIDVMSTGPYNLLPGDSILVAFALLAADSLPDLINSAIAAQIKHDTPTFTNNLQPNITAYALAPNPAADQITLRITNGDGIQKIIVRDLIGNIVSTQQFNANNRLESSPIDITTLPPGLYMMEVQGTRSGKWVGKFVINK